MNIWNKLSPDTQAHITSSIQTFASTFLSSFLLFLSTQTHAIENPSDWTWAFIASILLTAVRAGFKAAWIAVFPDQRPIPLGYVRKVVEDIKG